MRLMLIEGGSANGGAPSLCVMPRCTTPVRYIGREPYCGRHMVAEPVTILSPEEAAEKLRRQEPYDWEADQ